MLPAAAHFAAAEFQALTDREPAVLQGGTDAWAAAGLPTETGLNKAANAPSDVLIAEPA